jgi:hypothetical protein
MSSKVTYETRIKTKAGDGPRFIVDQFAGFFARIQALRHARKIIRRGEAEIATVFRVKRIRTFGK